MRSSAPCKVRFNENTKPKPPSPSSSTTSSSPFVITKNSRGKKEYPKEHRSGKFVVYEEDPEPFGSINPGDCTNNSPRPVKKKVKLSPSPKDAAKATGTSMFPHEAEFIRIELDDSVNGSDSSSSEEEDEDRVLDARRLQLAMQTGIAETKAAKAALRREELLADLTGRSNGRSSVGGITIGQNRDGAADESDDDDPDLAHPTASGKFHLKYIYA